ncbi:hypothetical protein OH76DRAFT_216172 [Lentinus brumalis]|uniref:Uncharacterized protein n=1 Tax=Lentinus brumalis TaxID=2498619 RepID=A0A371CMG9_9APHY|nr:hypothetical protein OH76DRAFT_216172 [Polyporus brumalis]
MCGAPACNEGRRHTAFKHTHRHGHEACDRRKRQSGAAREHVARCSPVRMPRSAETPKPRLPSPHHRSAVARAS